MMLPRGHLCVPFAAHSVTVIDLAFFTSVYDLAVQIGKPDLPDRLRLPMAFTVGLFLTTMNFNGTVAACKAKGMVSPWSI